MQKPLDKTYWDTRYDKALTGWDIGQVSTPLKEYIDQISDKNLAILIPGCGNAYEAEYLLEQGFTNITLIDISSQLVDSIMQKLKAYHGEKLNIICGDFFKLEKKFDLVLEQTFFCAIDPVLRKDYVAKMFSILKDDGKLAGVLFNREFEGGPPFGGDKQAYEKLFSEHFTVDKMEACYNSIGPRKGTELFFIVKKEGQLR